MSVTRPLIGLLLLIGLSACVSTDVDLPYRPGPSMVQREPSPIVTVGPFTDERKFEANYLGSIRGGYGNPLKRLRTAEPVAEIVRQQFADGLKWRGLLATSVDAPYTLSGVVKQFDCNQVARREAHAKILVNVTETASQRLLMSRLFTADQVTGSMITFDAGIFASTEDLRALANEVLQRVVDEALDSAEFQRIIARPAAPAASEPTAPPMALPSS